MKIGDLHGFFPVGMEGNDLNSQASVLFLPRVNPNARPELLRIRTRNSNCRFNGKRICSGGESSYTARFTTDSKLGAVLGCRGLILRHVSLLYACHLITHRFPKTLNKRGSSDREVPRAACP